VAILPYFVALVVFKVWDDQPLFFHAANARVPVAGWPLAGLRPRRMTGIKNGHRAACKERITATL
jgi:hypothetical protein